MVRDHLVHAIYRSYYAFLALQGFSWVDRTARVCRCGQHPHPEPQGKAACVEPGVPPQPFQPQARRGAPRAACNVLTIILSGRVWCCVCAVAVDNDALGSVARREWQFYLFCLHKPAQR